MATVLKSESSTEKTSAARNVSGLAGFNLSDLADEGRSRLEQCRRQIQQMLDQARQDAEELKQQAHAEGYAEGQRQAAVDAEQKLQREAEQRAKDGLQLIRSAVEQLHRVHEDWMRQYSESLSSIALAAAERIVRRKLEQDQQLLVQWADDALRSTRSAVRLTLAVHPETLAKLGQAFDELLCSPDLPEQTHVEPDESVDRDAVVVRQDGGEIRAGLQNQLDRLRELLT